MTYYVNCSCGNTLTSDAAESRIHDLEAELGALLKEVATLRDEGQQTVARMETRICNLEAERHGAHITLDACGIKSGTKNLTERIMLLQDERVKLQAFKDWVHAYLTAKGVPENPGGPHMAEGCRIGDRMDLLVADRDAAVARVSELEELFKDHDSWPRSKEYRRLKEEKDAAVARAESAEDALVAAAGVRIGEYESVIRDLDAQIAAMRKVLDYLHREVQASHPEEYESVGMENAKAALASDAGKPILAWIDRAVKALEKWSKWKRPSSRDWTNGACQDEFDAMKEEAAEVLKDKP